MVQKSTFEFWKRTADALGQPDVVPSPTIKSFYDWRLSKVGMGFAEFAETYDVYGAPLSSRSMKKRALPPRAVKWN